MPNIDTLEEDLKLLGTSFEPSEDQLAGLGASIALKTARAMEERTTTTRPAKTLYVSELGTKCNRQLWYKVHHPELAEPMPHNALFKFLYGDMIEETVLSMCKMAGHKVEHEQLLVTESFDGWKVRGRIDAVIDGVLVDVKSCSPFGFKKFKEGLNDDNDSFGYRTQINTYRGLFAANGVTGNGFLAADKLNGHIGWFEEKSYNVKDVSNTILNAVRVVAQINLPSDASDVRPAKRQSDTSPNMVLDTICSYCAFKKVCWKDANKGAGLIAYNYASGPVYFVDIKKMPAPHIKRLF